MAVAWLGGVDWSRSMELPDIGTG